MTATLDGHGSGQATATNAVTATLTTANIGDRIMVLVSAENQSADPMPSVSSVTASGLSFTNRTVVTVTGSGGQKHDAEVWYADAVSALSAVAITANFAANFDDAVIFVFGVSGTALAFDSDGSLPAHHQTSDGHWYANVSTASTAPFVFAFSASGDSTPVSGAMTPSGYMTGEDSRNNFNGAGQDCGAWGYGLPGAAVAATNVGWSASGADAGGVVIIDALVEVVTWTGAANLSATATLTAVSDVEAAATLSATASLATAGTVARLGAASLSAAATLGAAAVVLANIANLVAVALLFFPVLLEMASWDEIDAPIDVEIHSALVPPPTPAPPASRPELADPTTAPTLSHVGGGDLVAGTYDYCYQAWQIDPVHHTAASPTATITFLADNNAVEVDIPDVVSADGYRVFRRGADGIWIYVADVEVVM